MAFEAISTSVFSNDNGSDHIHGISSQWVHKVISKPTGTSVEYKDFKSAINMSLTSCKINAGLLETDGHISPLLSIVYRNNNTEVIEDYNTDHNMFNSFYWFKNDLIHICNTISLKSADEIQLVHSFGLKNMGENNNMILYIHETGLFGSGYEVKIIKKWYEGNTVVLLDLQQIVKLPEPSVCSQDYLYDKCKQRFISNKLNAKIGCFLKLQKR